MMLVKDPFEALGDLENFDESMEMFLSVWQSLKRKYEDGGVGVVVSAESRRSEGGEIAWGDSCMEIWEVA